MQVLGSFLSPGFFCLPISSLANAFPKASPHPMLKAVPLVEGERVADADDAPCARWEDNNVGRGTKALTEQALATRAIKAQVNFMLGGRLDSIRSAGR